MRTKPVILVTEDHPLWGPIITELLKANGYDVDLVTTGEIALRRLFLLKSYDLLVLDVMLPGGKSGRDIFSELRSSESRQLSDLPVVVLSAAPAGESDPWWNADDQGHNFRWLSKSDVSTHLIEVVRQLLDQKRPATVSGENKAPFEDKFLRFCGEFDEARRLEIREKISEMTLMGYDFTQAPASLDVLLARMTGRLESLIEVVNYRAESRDHLGKERLVEATIEIKVDNVAHKILGQGVGPVNALENALRIAVEPKLPLIEELNLIDFNVHVVNPRDGSSTAVVVTAEWHNRDKNWVTMGVSKDIIEASWFALIDSFDFLLWIEAD